MRARFALFALLTVVATAYVVGSLQVRTSIVDFLPDDEHSNLLRIARDLSQAPQSKVVVLTLSAREEESHRAAAKSLAVSLKKSGLTQWVRGGLDEREQELFYQTFYPARLGLTQLEREGPIADDVLDARVRALRARLASPLGALTRELAPGDPLGLFEALTDRLARSQGELVLTDGQLTSRDGRWSVLLLELRSSPFDAEAQRSFQATLARELSVLRQSDASRTLEWTSVGRFAEAAERSIRGDIERISLFSTLGILLLYIFVFRSLREPLLVMLPIAFGSVLALAACQLTFGFVHGLSLAFGTSIVGVAEDFSTHYFTHRLASASEDNEALMRRLWPGMLLGGLTTVIGIASLFFSGFPGLAQMAVFGAVGVLGALFCTRYIVPPLTRRKHTPRATSRGRRMSLALLAQKPPVVALLLAAPIALALLGIPRLHFQDGVAALRTRTAQLDAENERVQARLGRSAAAGRVVVALGVDDEAALRVAEQVHQRLSALPTQQLAAQRTVVDLLPSVSTQTRRQARLRDDSTLRARLHAVLQRHDLVPDAFEPFFEQLRAPQKTLTPATLLGSPLGSLVAPFRAEIAGQTAYLSAVSASSSQAVSSALAGVASAFYVDQEALYSAAYGRFRERALSLSVWGALLVFLAILVRYRSLKTAALGMLPAVIGASGALGVLGVWGVPVSFINVIAVLLVLSMGEDYGIYAIECEDDDEAATTLGSVLLAAATTVLSFGLLGLSDNPALAAIGLTVSVGLLFSVLASPVVLVLARRIR